MLHVQTINGTKYNDKLSEAYEIYLKSEGLEIREEKRVPGSVTRWYDLIPPMVTWKRTGQSEEISKRVINESMSF